MNDSENRPFSPDDISDWFWSIIERAAGSRDELREILSELSKEEVFRFNDEFDEAAAQLTDEPFADELDPDASEDTIEDTSNWVVSQGKAYYSRVWNEPSRIPKDVDVDDPRYLQGVAGEVFWDRFGEEIGEFEP